MCDIGRLRSTLPAVWLLVGLGMAAPSAAAGQEPEPNRQVLLERIGVLEQRLNEALTAGEPSETAGRAPAVNLNVTKTAAVVIDSGPQNTVRFGAGPLRLGSQVVARRIDVFGPFRAVMAGRIGTWVARDCHIRVNPNGSFL